MSTKGKAIVKAHLQEQPQDQFAIIKCDAAGNIIDSNFSSRKIVTELYQKNEQGKLIKFDQTNPNSSTVFGLVSIDHDGNLKSSSGLVPRSKETLTIVEVHEDGTIKDVEPIEIQNTYAQIECDASGNILDPNFARYQKVEEFYQVD